MVLSAQTVTVFVPTYLGTTYLSGTHTRLPTEELQDPSFIQ